MKNPNEIELAELVWLTSTSAFISLRSSEPESERESEPVSEPVLISSSSSWNNINNFSDKVKIYTRWKKTLGDIISVTEWFSHLTGG